MDATSFATPLAAFVAGLVTSVHCAGMCGPLTCAAFGQCGSVRPPLAYHAARTAAYALAGGLLASVGGGAAALFAGSPTRWLPWAFAVLFLLVAFGLEKRIPAPAFLSRLLLRWRLKAAGGGGAALLGVLTPFLPCGPLYLALGVALLAGSFANGAMLMGAFAIGTIPLLFVAQTQFHRIPLSPRNLQRLRRGLAFASAMLLLWRGWAGGSGLETGGCPLCH